MQIKNKQLEGYKEISVNYVMPRAEDLVVASDGLNITLPVVQDGDFFRVLFAASTKGTSTFAAPVGFTVDGAATFNTNAGTGQISFVQFGGDWVSFPIIKDSILSAPGALLAANACAGTSILIPSGNFKDVRTVGTAGTYANLAAALADTTVVAGTILKLISNVADTAAVTLNRAVVVDLNGFTYSNNTTVGISLTANLATIKNGTVHHTKTVNTSIETAINIDLASGIGTAFIVDSTLKVQEFGIALRGAAMITGCTFQYDGASATNSHRFIAIYGVYGETRIHNNTFECSVKQGTTRYSNFVFMGAGLLWNAPLFITDNIQTGGDLRQFVFNEGLVPTPGAELIVTGNTFNDFNGGIGLINPSLYNGLSKIVIADNTQGGDAIGNFKGVFFVDGTGTLSDAVDFQHGGNVTSAGPIRADYVTMVEGSDNLIARKNVITQAAPIPILALEDAVDEAGRLLQNLKDTQVYAVDKDGNRVAGYGSKDQPLILNVSSDGLVTDEFYATAGQIEFTLSATPRGFIGKFVSGSRVPNAAFTVSGTSVTYNPLGNNNNVLTLGQRVNFDYVA
jgi:hypothetical protein